MQGKIAVNVAILCKKGRDFGESYSVSQVWSCDMWILADRYLPNLLLIFMLEKAWSFPKRQPGPLDTQLCRVLYLNCIHNNTRGAMDILPTETSCLCSFLAISVDHQTKFFSAHSLLAPLHSKLLIGSHSCLYPLSYLIQSRLQLRFP